MATQQIAQGLSSLGRYGDSTLVHMQPEEVAGLQALAKSQGTSLTIHPETGLPEAFSLGGFFKSLLPTIAGAGLSVASGGALSPLAIGLITGGVTAAATGDLKQGIMGGLGGFGGAGLGSSLQGFGAAAPAANTAVNTAATGAQQVGQASAVAGAGDAAAIKNELVQAALMRSGQSQAANAISPGIDFANVPSGGPGIFGASSQPVNFNALYGAQPVVSSGAGVNLAGQMSTDIPASGVMNQPAIMSGAKGFEQAGSGISRAFQNPSAYADYVGGTTKALTSVGMPLVGAGLGGMEAPVGMTQEEFDAERRAKLNKPLNLNYDTGLRLAGGGAIQTGGVMDLYQGTDSQATFGGSQGYGLGRLNNLAQQQSMTNAEQGRFARGGVPRLEDGGFVVPADVTFYMGNHNTEAGQERLAQMYGGQPIKGKGTGLSDSIPTSIEGKEPARIANGEVYISRKAVMSHGGPEKFYKMMDKVRKQATGSTKQAKSA
jgi:hypothetical protein